MSGVPGARRGIRRGRYRNGVIYVNGHPPYPKPLADLIISEMKQVGRLVNAEEIAYVLGYSYGWIRNVMRWMAIDGLVHLWVPGRSPFKAVYGLEPPGADVKSTIMKQCSKCHRRLSIDDFGRDSHTSDGHSYACRDCRSTVPPERRRGRRRQRVSA